MKKQKGFTVIELLVVIFILGLLLAVALPRFQKAKDQSFADSMVAKINTLNLSLEEFRSQCGFYPSVLGGETSTGGCSLTHAQFLPGNSTDNFGDVLYVSLRDSSIEGCTGYHIGALVDSDRLLSTDEDLDSNNLPGDWRLCESGSGFDGQDITGEESYYDITTIQ